MEPRLIAALEALHRDGSPIATPNTYERLATIALRRWTSFPHRTKLRRPTRDDRILDLAKGLCTAFEPNPSLAGPLLADYHHTAETLAGVLAPID